MALLKLGNDQEVDVLLPVCKSGVISAKHKIASFFSATKQAKAKDVRFHPKFPYAYDVTKYGSLYTIVERLGPMEEKKKLMNRLREKYESYRHLLPLLLRYMKETLLPLGKVRLAICQYGILQISSGGADIGDPRLPRKHFALYHTILATPGEMAAYRSRACSTRNAFSRSCEHVQGNGNGCWRIFIGRTPEETS